jgi:hypothetical protein
MYFNCTYIQNNYYIIDKPQIEKGDVVVKAGEHVFIYESGANDRYDIMHGAEANVSPPDGPVNSHCVEFNPNIDYYLDVLGYVLRSYFDPSNSIEPGEPTETAVPILHQNFPNPFDCTTTISYSLSNKARNPKIVIYNIKGQKVKTFMLEERKGENSIIWEGKDEAGKYVSSGIYFQKLVNNNKVIDVKKMLLIK